MEIEVMQPYGDATEVTQHELRRYLRLREKRNDYVSLGARIKMLLLKGLSVEEGKYKAELIRARATVPASKYRAWLVAELGEATVRRKEGGALKGKTSPRISVTTNGRR
jgi:hypothetical protein